jgi:hypothetical protein
MFQKKISNLVRSLIMVVVSVSLMFTNFGGVFSARAATLTDAIVFVSRQIPGNGSVYYPQGGSMPGVQPYSRFQVAAPGKLIVREANGTLRVLIDGSKPTAASLNLIDVNAPDVSYDAKKIVFAGLPAGTYSSGAVGSPGAWRIYVINVDGTGLRQITFSDRNISLSQFGSVASNFTKYDDTDPVWLPDGRIVFSSTRWPSFGQYGAALTSNLYVVNADGTNLHRITAERNGAERPVIDPLTGKIVYSRWWRNFRLGTNNMATIPYSGGGYIMKDGVCALKFQGAECQEAGGLTNLERNAWHLASINPDGTGLAQFAGRSNSFFVGESVNHAYGGAFAPDGTFYANFFPMTNGTEAAGFGGIRRYQRGANGYTHVIGITNRDESVQRFVSTNPTSYGVFVGNYAADPAVLPDGGLLISWAQDTRQDYGLYVINADGSGRTLVYDNPGTTELRAKLIRPRPLPPIIPDQVTQVASALPPTAQGPYDKDGTFTFNALNVYFNAPVDVDILSAPPVGSANTIRFYTDFQRDQQRGSFEYLDWPIFLKEVPVNPDGSVMTSSPANIPLFEQLRTSPEKGYTIPLTGRGASPDEMGGAAHVAGMNFGRTGDVQRCVGCHAGHTMIPIPADPQWTNLAPGATVTYSSLHSSLPNGNGAVDRKVRLRIAYNNHYRFWLSREGQNPNTQWLQLTFPVPVTVRTVRLYDMPASESNINVNNTTVRLYSDTAAKNQVASKTSGALSENGTDVSFNDVRARVVRIEFTSVSGSTAGLAEVEVIARGEAIETAVVPQVSSITRLDASPTSSASVRFNVSFSEDVSGVDKSDFVLSGIGVGGAYISSVSGSGASYTVLVNTAGACSGTIRLDLVDDDSIKNSSGYPLNGSGVGNGNFSGGEAYSIDKQSNMDVSIASNRVGCYNVNSQTTTFSSYPNVVDGPVMVTSKDGSPIFTSQVVSSGDSYNELMGYPANQLTTEYWFPYYDHGYPNVAGSNMRTWILVGNASATQSANVEIYIGGVLRHSETIAPSGRITPRWVGLQGGPVRVISTNSVPIFASERVFTSTNNAFNENLGYPANQFAAEYWFPWYDDVNMSNFILVGNTSSNQPAEVDIYIAGVKKGTFSIPANSTLIRRFTGEIGGPVRVVSANGVHVVASQKSVSGPGKSYNEVLGYPSNQFETEYWFPWYDHGFPNVAGSNMRTWILVGNPNSTQTAEVDIYINGTLMNHYSIAAGSNITPRWVGLQAGPVRVVSTNGVPIFASERVFTAPNSVFNEMMGYPLTELTTEYWFPWYDSVNMGNQLLISKP